MDVRGEAQLQPAFDVIEAAVKDKAFPGATLAVGYKGKVSVHAFGKLSYDAKSPSVNVDTMYDIASLTKSLGRRRLRKNCLKAIFRCRWIWTRKSSGICRMDLFGFATGVAASRDGAPLADAHVGTAAFKDIGGHRRENRTR